MSEFQSVFHKREELMKMVNQERDTNKRTAEAEQRGERWSVHGSGLADYKADFGELWPDILPRDMIALDIMGNGQFIRDLQKEGYHIRGIGIELSDTRSDEDKQFDATHGNSIVAGDILNRETWNNISSALHGNAPNFIVCRGVGGVDYLPSDPHLSYVLLDRAYRLLSNKQGILLTQVQAMNRDLLENWYASTKNTGVNVQLPAYTIRPRLKIIKNEGSPARLPAIK